MNQDDTKYFTSANRLAWEEVAPIHREHNQDRLIKAFGTPGFSCLDEIETAQLKALGVAGKDVAQVCCNNGRELLSVKNMGAARCVGFDGAQAFLDQGKELTSVANLDVEFVCSDAYEINAAYRNSFDIVTITIGVLSWMPDINGFFEVVSGLVKPGGAIFIYEQHPIVEMVKPAGPDEPIEWELSYFHDEPYVETGGLDYYGGESYDAKPVTSFCHKLSDIFMAAIGNSLRIENFAEYPHHISNAWYNVEKSDIGLPMCYTLVLRKDG